MSNFSFVQASTGALGSTTQPFPANNVAGNCIVVVVYELFGTSGLFQGNTDLVTDTQRNVYTAIQQSVGASPIICVATHVKAGPNTVSISSAYGAVGGMVALEYHSAASTYYVCPGSGAGISNISVGWENFGAADFTSSAECMVVWGRQVTGVGTVWTPVTGTVRYSGNVPGDYGIGTAAGDDDISSCASYANYVTIDGASLGSGTCVFLNLTGGCPGGAGGTAPAPPAGTGGTSQPDSSFGGTASSSVALNPGNLLVYFEGEDRWMYHRNAIGIDRFQGFLFDGIQMLGLTGTIPSSGAADAVAYNVDDFRGFLTEDAPVTGSTSLAIQSIAQTHYEDVGQPDNQKVWLEVVLDCIVGAGLTATVYWALDDGLTFPLTALGTFTGTGSRQKVGITLDEDGTLAKNISIGFSVTSTATSALQELHNIYLYYYVEARLALAAATIPVDLGSPQVKQCKELMLDIDASLGTVDSNIYSDLPGNTLAVRQTPAIATSAGRAIMKFPFPVTEGFLWRVALRATSGTFRLYSARLLMRPIGVYVEAYESTNGFVYDSEPHSFESLLTKIPRAYAIALSATPIKRYRELSLEIETYGGNVLVSFLTDLPGNTEVVRCTFTINTAALGRRFIRLPLPQAISAAAWAVGTTYAAGAFANYAGNGWQSLQAANTGNTPAVSSTWWQPLPIEGRVCRLQLSGTSKYVLYDAAVELLPVGLYIEAYEASTGAVYDSREMDFGSQKPKEARELELDIETTGPVTATLYCDLPGYTMTPCYVNTNVSTTGRQKVLLPLTLDSAPYDYPIGRFYRLVITGTNAFRLYDAQLKLREFGCYLVGDEASASPLGVFDTTPIDCGTERLKEFKKIELEIQTDSTGTATLNLWTDQPACSLTQQFTTTIQTNAARMSVKIPLTYGIRGRLLQVEVSGCGVRLFNGRVWARPFNEPTAKWAWVPFAIPPTPGEWAWAKFPVNPTPPTNDLSQWLWGKFTSVTETPNEWTWVDLDMSVSGS